MEQKPLPRILVVEDEPEIRELVTFFIQSEFKAEIVEAENGLEAKKILEKDTRFDIIISDYTMPEMSGGALLQYIRENKIQSKFILMSAIDAETVAEVHKVMPDAVAAKPLFTQPLLDALSIFLTDPVVENHVSIAVEHLNRAGEIPFAVYARLSDQKFIKVLHEHDFFGSEDLVRFQKKGISHLFLQRDDAKAFFKKQLDLYVSLAQTKDQSSDDIIQLGDEITSAVHDMASNFGFSKDLEQLTKIGIDLALKNISSNLPLRELLKNLDLKTGNYLAIHSSRLPYIANHITRLMGWSSDSTAYKMALASMIHDSTLSLTVHAEYKEEARLAAEAAQKLSSTHLEEFYRHPLQAAELTLKFSGIPPDIDTIVAQHHERCDGSGFPQGINHTRIAPLSCVFIIAHDLLCFYEEEGKNFKIENFIALRQNEYSAGNFKKILHELAMLELS